MNAMRYVLVLVALTLSLAGHNHVAAAGKAAPQTFVCKHCGIKMTTKKPSDMQMKCWVCKCKKPASACKPTAKK